MAWGFESLHPHTDTTLWADVLVGHDTVIVIVLRDLKELQWCNLSRSVWNQLIQTLMRQWWNGRHATLRGWWEQSRESSSLSCRTITKKTLVEQAGRAVTWIDRQVPAELAGRRKGTHLVHSLMVCEAAYGRDKLLDKMDYHQKPILRRWDHKFSMCQQDSW